MAGIEGRDAVLSLFLIDDHPIVGLGLTMALQGHAHLRLVGTAATQWNGLERLETLSPDVLIVDLVYDGEAETNIVRESRALLPEALIVVFSSLPKRIYEREVLELGADAYVSKSTDIALLLDSVSQMVSQPRNRTLQQRLAVEDRDTVIDGVHLTPREADVASRLGAGLSISRIANELDISANTVGVHRDNLRKKLKCRDMTELVALLAHHRTVLPEQVRLK